VPSNPVGATIVRASSGAILGTVTSTGVESGSAFDGEHVLIGSGLFKAADRTFLGVLPIGGPSCSDGMSFWVCNATRLSRF
jgi:hypothetical protein